MNMGRIQRYVSTNTFSIGHAKKYVFSNTQENCSIKCQVYNIPEAKTGKNGMQVSTRVLIYSCPGLTMSIFIL